MILINADDWGRSQSETDAALRCYGQKAITSVSAMVYMADSSRAADLAKDSCVDVGLHLNLSQPFTGNAGTKLLIDYHDRIRRFLTNNKYAQLLYNPILKKKFEYVYLTQLNEFIRLYGKQPSHIDGHQHMHLCTNMLVDMVIPQGEKVRRSFSFRPGEKSFLNRMYRRLIDVWLARSYRVTDYFFALSQNLDAKRIAKIVELAKSSTVELMTHPINTKEYAFLMSTNYLELVANLRKNT